MILNWNWRSGKNGPRCEREQAQTNRPDFSRVHGATLNYLRRSAEAGKPWVVACDEPGDATHSLLPDEEDPDRDEDRDAAAHREHADQPALHRPARRRACGEASRQCQRGLVEEGNLH